mmetsp:Transcript_1196/g.5020  ORF Transcript_1196/g.5020 Transcript_1196/m.5020 type:complete len:307 (-) Transcript_1196:989-1909(-)
MTGYSRGAGGRFATRHSSIGADQCATLRSEEKKPSPSPSPELGYTVVLEICVAPAVICATLSRDDALSPSKFCGSSAQSSSSYSSAHSQYKRSCSKPRPETISPRNTRRSAASAGGGTNAPGPARRRRASCNARIAAVGAMSFCRFSSGVSSLVEAFVTLYSQTLPSRRSTRYISPSLSWQKSGESATEPSGNASMVMRISSPSFRRRNASSPPAIAGWSGGSSSGPQSAQITKVTGIEPPRRLRPRASSVRFAVASAPRALAATTRAAGEPKIARNKPLTRSVADVVTVFSASRSSANRSAATYV